MRYSRSFCIAAAVIAIAAVFLLWQDQTLAPQEMPAVQEMPIQEEKKQTVEEKADSPYAERQQKVAEYLSALDSGYAVYLSYPAAVEEPALVYGKAPSRSASMIKVFLMSCLCEKAQAGQVDLQERLTLNATDKVGGAGELSGYPDGSRLSLEQLMELMITKSDNTATNMLLDYIGMDEVNSYLLRHGYNDTSWQRHMMDTEAVRMGLDNYTSATDLGKFFQLLYRHECVSEAYDSFMLDVLKRQTDTECFSAALPAAVIAHKTGELTGLYADGGIVYADDGDFVLVIIRDNYDSRYGTICDMQQLARLAAGQPL